MNSPSDARLVDGLTTVVSRAAATVLAVRGDAFNTRLKPDRSPVTAADEAAETVILEGVTRLLPGIPAISEEACGNGSAMAAGDAYILVDPLDGTRELLAGRDEFSINLALIQKGRPVIGIVAAPALGLIWRTAAGNRAERLTIAPGADASAATACTTIRTRPWPKAGAIAAVSRSHFDSATDAFLAPMKDVTRMMSGSAIKFCRVAEAAADIYPRLSPTHQWDVAAGHAVLAAAGGTVTTPERASLSYRAEADGLLIPGFIAWGDPSAAGVAR